MENKLKTVCDVCALVTGGFGFFVENAPTIAAILSAIWLAIRIVEWAWAKINKRKFDFDG